MKRLNACQLSLLLISLTAVTGWSKGIFILPGTRDSAMGSAMVAIADNPTAVYYNPAGLALQKGSGLEASVFYLQNDAKGSKSYSNSASPVSSNGDFPLAAYLPSEPAQFQNKKFKTEALLPFIGGYTKVEDLTFALSVYGIGGGGGKWKDAVMDSFTGTDKVTASLDASYAFIIYNLSVAKEMTPKLSAGLGIDIVNMIDTLNAQKGYTRGPGSLMPQDYGVTLDQSATGSGIQFDGGVLYKISDKINCGAVVRSGTMIKLSGKATLNGNETDYDKDYLYPPTLGAGISYEPSNELTLAFALDQNKYSLMHEAERYKTQVGLSNVSQPLNGLNWKDTVQVRLGSEYRLTGRFALQAGIQTDPVPFATDQLSLSELNQYNFMYYSVGASYKIGSINFDICYAFCPSDSPSIGDRSYEYPLDVFRFGARYSF